MYVFYDFETTGLSPAFDQPTQFAAVVTDEDFNEIETIHWRCKLSHHILPSPWALTVTKTSFFQLDDSSLPTLFEISTIIQDFITKWTPAVWIGYNSINFDEIVLRQIFYQNLQPNIFATQLNGNSRIDILKLIYGVYVFRRSEFIWPMTDSGAITFKLDQLVSANGYDSHNAHDALGDVRATIFLARKIKKKCTELWKNSTFCSNKHGVNSLLATGAPLLMVSRLGSGPPIISNIVYAGRSLEDQNKVVVLDLDVLIKLQISIRSLLKSNMREFFNRDRHLFKIIRINASPLIFKNDNPSKSLLEQTIKIKQSFNLSNQISLFLSQESRKKEKSNFVELQIYDAFVSEKDKDILTQMGCCNWEERNEMFKNLKDKRLRRLSRRLLLLESPIHLSKEIRRKSFDAILTRWNYTEKEGPMWTTFASVTRQLNELHSLGRLSERATEDFKKFYAHRPEKLKRHIEID